LQKGKAGDQLPFTKLFRGDTEKEEQENPKKTGQGRRGRGEGKKSSGGEGSMLLGKSLSAKNG